MSAILDKLIELITAWITYLVPMKIVGDDECGLIRRFGKFHRLTQPGWNWKWPLVETTMLVSAALESEVLREQTLTTSDGVQITVRPAIAYRVVDPKKYILDCGETVGLINDVGGCVVAEVLPKYTAQQVLHSDDFDGQLLRKVKSRAKRWGIEVDSFGLVERVKTRTYRLITGDTRLSN